MTASQSVLRASAFCFSALCCLGIILSPASPAYYWLGITLLYDEVPLAEAQIVRDIPYDRSAPDDVKRQLDLFLPNRPEFPVVVFIHGGQWERGDRRHTVAGADIYANIGRMLASEGFGAAVISYRLLSTGSALARRSPKAEAEAAVVDWWRQAGDVARAVAWVQNNAPKRGAQPKAVFLMGHSAGAQLAARMAADPKWLHEAGGSSSDLCGVIGVSGAGYDLEDAETRRLETDKEYFLHKFASNRTDRTWRQEASPARWLDSADPRFLLMYADDDFRPLMRQAQVIDEQTRTLGINGGLVVVPDATHHTVVLKLSNAKSPAGEAILEFLRNTPCPRLRSH